MRFSISRTQIFYRPGLKAIEQGEPGTRIVQFAMRICAILYCIDCVLFQNQAAIIFIERIGVSQYAFDHPFEGHVCKTGTRIAATDIGMDAGKPHLLDMGAFEIFFIPNQRPKGPPFVIDGDRMEDMLYRSAWRIVIEFVTADQVEARIQPRQLGKAKRRNRIPQSQEFDIDLFPCASFRFVTFLAAFIGLHGGIDAVLEIVFFQFGFISIAVFEMLMHQTAVMDHAGKGRIVAAPRLKPKP